MNISSDLINILSATISSILKLIRDLTVIYTLTKFGADWSIFVDARALTRKLWMDGQTDGHQTDGRTDNNGQRVITIAQ